MNQIRSSNLTELYGQALSLVLDQGSNVSPRGLPTKEALFTMLSLSDPRARCVEVPERHWSLPLAVGEFCWHASASDDLSFVAWYAPKWKTIATDNRVLGSCYGRRVFARCEGLSQWQKTKKLILQDPDTRRATLYFHDVPAEHLTSTAPDLPCASMMQFVLRGGALHASVYMRSNDAYLGLPYDVFIFTMLHELMATQLNVELGEYHHVVASLHIYREHEHICEQIRSLAHCAKTAMPAMQAPHQVEQFLQFEHRVRTGETLPIIQPLHPYWLDLLRVLSWHRGRRLDLDDPFAALGRPQNALYNRLLAVAPTKPLARADH